MLKLNAGISRKVGEPDYGSRGASVNLELEVEGHLAQDPEGLLDRIRRLFALARQAVDQELQSPAQNGNGQHRAAPPPRDGRVRLATASQLRAIRAIAECLNLDPGSITGDTFGVGLDELTIRQASQLIDQLKSRNGTGSRT